MEISGSIRSFITNHKRIYEENISEIARTKKKVSENKKKAKPTVLDAESPLREYIEKLEVPSYEDIITPYKSLQEYENILLAFNEIVAEYNYEANQLNTAQKLGLSMLDKLSRLPAFPGVTEKQYYELEIIFEKLKELSNLRFGDLGT